MATDPNDGEPISDDLLKAVFLTAFPNPNRTGCPEKYILRQISKRQLSPNHPAFDHVAQCSPCNRDIQTFQANHKRSVRFARLTVAAMLIAGAAASAIYMSVRNYTSPGGVKLPSPHSQQTAILNFEMLSRQRGESHGNTQPLEVQRIPRGHLLLSMYLPRGSEPGQYEIRFLRSQADQKPLLSASATARIDNGLTVLQVLIDSSVIETGSYIVAFRHDFGSWRYAAIMVS